ETSDLPNDKLITSSKNTQITASEQVEIYLNYGMKKRLKFLKTQILQTMKKLSSYQIELIQQSGCNVEDLASSLNQLNLDESSLTEDINILESMADTKKEVDLLWRSILAGESPKKKSSTTLTERSRMTELKTYI